VRIVPLEWRRLRVMNRNGELQQGTASVVVSSPILFHCWRHEDRTAARLILKSICRNGLLLTTNSKTLDSFAIDRGSGVVPMEVMQHARVCFTDIRSDRSPLTAKDTASTALGSVVRRRLIGAVCPRGICPIIGVIRHSNASVPCS
jgi:hypothetical protein